MLADPSLCSWHMLKTHFYLFKKSFDKKATKLMNGVMKPYFEICKCILKILFHLRVQYSQLSISQSQSSSQTTFSKYIF